MATQRDMFDEIEREIEKGNFAPDLKRRLLYEIKFLKNNFDENEKQYSKLSTKNRFNHQEMMKYFNLYKKMENENNELLETFSCNVDMTAIYKALEEGIWIKKDKNTYEHIKVVLGKIKGTPYLIHLGYLEKDGTSKAYSRYYLYTRKIHWWLSEDLGFDK